MSERNQIKSRECKTCGEYVWGKASKLKEHGRDCKRVLAEAAQQALMAEIQQNLADYDEPDLADVLADLDNKLQEDLAKDAEEIPVFASAAEFYKTPEQQIRDAFTTEELDQLKIRLADEGVLNAEGD